MINHNKLGKNIFLRKKYIHMRKQLNYQQQYYASKKISKIMINYDPIKKAKNIALYFSTNGEVNTHFLISELLKNKKNIYLPIIKSFSCKKLLFIKYKKLKDLKNNKLNILEPKFNITKLISLHLLDVIILPTVLFDNFGNRLGMGGGFYDYTLQYWKKNNFLLIGLAYDFQKIKKLKNKKWDVPLSIVITPSKIYKWENIKKPPKIWEV